MRNETLRVNTPNPKAINRSTVIEKINSGFWGFWIKGNLTQFMPVQTAGNDHS